jgi:hypothetical protein
MWNLISPYRCEEATPNDHNEQRRRRLHRDVFDGEIFFVDVPKDSRDVRPRI